MIFRQGLNILTSLLQWRIFEVDGESRDLGFVGRFGEIWWQESQDFLYTFFDFKAWEYVVLYLKMVVSISGLMTR